MKPIVKILSVAVLAVVTFAAGAPAALAHPGHDEPITKDAAMQRASSEVTRLVTAGKLDKSWKLGAALQSAELRSTAKGKEWAVTYANPQAPNEAERTLYVFLSESGEYLAANFTGR
jgi:hypothetical protein